MPPPSVTTDCPVCARRFAVRLREEPPGDGRWWNVDEIDVECPICGWEFRIEAEEGRVTDDGQPDSEPLFEVDAEGELAADVFPRVTCTRCGHTHEVEGPGVFQCPNCHRMLDVDARGQVGDGVITYWDCPQCGVTMRGPRDTLTFRCGECGCLAGPEDTIYCDSEDEVGESDAVCPDCGYGDASTGRDLLALPVSGRLWCPACGTEFDAGEAVRRDRGEASPAAGLAPWRGSGERPACVVSADGTASFAKITTAIRRAEPGQVIRIGPGEYRESVVIDKPVALVADGPPGSVRLVASGCSALTIKCIGCEVRGLVVTCRGATAVLVDTYWHSPDPCPPRPLLEDCTITGDGPAGVVVREAGFALVLRNCRVTGAGGVGVRVEGGGRAVFEACTVGGCAAAAVESGEGGRVRLSGSTVRDNGGEGVVVQARAEVLLEDCLLSANGGDAVAARGGHVRLVRSRAVDGRSAGVRVRDGVAVVDGCEISGNGGSGVVVSAGGKAVLQNCRVRANAVHGLHLTDCARVLATNCEFSENRGRAAAAHRHGRLHLIRCRVGGNGATLRVGPQAQVGLEACDLSGNRHGGTTAPGGLILFQPLPPP